MNYSIILMFYMSESIKFLYSEAWTSFVFSHTLLNFGIVIIVFARPFQRDQISASIISLLLSRNRIQIGREMLQRSNIRQDYLPVNRSVKIGLSFAILVNVSVLSSLSLASIILEYICCSLWVFKFLICCSLCNCIFFLIVEKFISAIIKRPETTATEMSGAYVKNESISFRNV